ncbi:MAG TPA: response regulator [Gemmatimonadaceae bacterium]|nr:response regulator [Gemmatimonadaceae bacterium]
MKDVILLVEDNVNDQELTLRALRKNNLTTDVVTVGDGVEALDYLFGTGRYADVKDRPTPRVVLLDLKLPRLGGIDVLRRLRADARTKWLPVVIFTSSREDQDIIEGYRFGATSYVRKPVLYTEFLEAVRELGLYWLMRNERPPHAPDNAS